MMPLEVFNRFYEIGSTHGIKELEHYLKNHKKAVFLDRDGVINPLVYNAETGEYESPHHPVDFSLFPYTLKSLKKLKELGYLIIVVSNQPSFAKGKTSLDNINEIGKILEKFSEENGNLIDDSYYCYHHPNGIVREYSVACSCRKPGVQFLQEAIEKHNISCVHSYLVGDCDTDILCGKKMGLHTIKLNYKYSEKKSGTEEPCVFASDLNNAVEIINKK
jgi:D-glycero-D-manno-heptose 1,7-bisphosphate phosphatase